MTNHFEGQDVDVNVRKYVTENISYENIFIFK